MKPQTKKMIVFMLLLVITVSSCGCGNGAFSFNRVHAAESDRQYYFTDEQLMDRLFDLDQLPIIARVETELILDEGQRGKLSLNLTKAGKYALLLKYQVPEAKIFNCEIEVNVSSVATRSKLPSYWEDQLGGKDVDKYNNEIVPDQNRLEGSYYEYIVDSTSYSQLPLSFDFSTGENEIEITPTNQSLLIEALYVVELQEEPDYKDYSAKFNGVKAGKDFITVEAEDFRAKTDSYIRGRNVSGVAVQPNDNYVKLINATDDKSNKELGQKVTYEFEINSAGLYKFAFKYSQPLKVGGASYRTLEIDGKTLFQQMRDIPFLHTGIDKYENYVFGASQPYEVFLEKGLHTVTFAVTAAINQKYYDELMSIIDEMNLLSVDIKKIRGSSSDDSVAVDSTRTWDIFAYIPDIIERITDWEKRLSAVYEGLRVEDRVAPSYASDIMLAVQNLKKLRSQPSKIPSRLSLLSDASSSACQLAATVLTKLSEQNLSFDRFYIYGEGKIPSARVNIFKSFWYGVTQFFYSFSENMNKDDSSKNKEAVTVWVNRSSQYVEVMRDLTAREFTKKTGIDVIFSIMPDENKLTLANSTGSNPDVALGVSYYKPADFAMRGIAKNLLEYDDFIEWYGSEYNIEALRPMNYQDGIFGVSETQDFYVLYYRTDILQSLGLSVPDTWEDVKAMMPTLLRNAMNFCLPLATSITYKNFAMTSPFIYQNKGDYYTSDGFHANFNDPETLKGIKESIDLYLVYGLQQNVSNFFNSFRSGATPIGVSNFATYLQLQVSAPELAGRWDIALSPGTKQDDGTITRYQTGDANASMIFENSSKPKEAYKFFKWWLSKDTQVQYANDLLRKYGKDYVWNTANIEAFKDLPYQQSHKDIILEQYSWQREVLRHPASYILEQEMSQMWIDIVVNKKQFQPRIDEAILRSDREMLRKLTEFGFYDKEGNIVKPFYMYFIDQLKEKYGQGGAK